MELDSTHRARVKRPTTRIEALRRIDEQVGCAVQATFDSPGVPLAAFVSPTKDKTLESFEDAVIDRLAVPDGKRREEERVNGAGQNNSGSARPRSKGKARRRTQTQAQVALPGGDDA